MGEPVVQSAGDAFGAEPRGPFVDRNRQGRMRAYLTPPDDSALIWAFVRL
jgi:hypothetical protein